VRLEIQFSEKVLHGKFAATCLSINFYAESDGGASAASRPAGSRVIGEMDQMFNLFVRNRMVWLEDICGATVFDYVLQCLIHDFLL